MLIPDNRKLLVRCETNIFNLYRGAEEAELKIGDDAVWTHGKVSPTTDQRSSGTSSKGGDPDNSALQAGAGRLFGFRLDAIYFLFQLAFVLLVMPALS